MASADDAILQTGDPWTAKGKVRCRECPGGLEVSVDGITTQPRYYKVLLYEFFRKE